jgi:hypothetical protein
MQMHTVSCSLVGGPLGARRVLFVRKPENRILPESLYFRLGSRDECYRYELDEAAALGAGKGFLFIYAGVDADDPDAEIAEERYAETRFPDDGKPAKKARLFFANGPFDGGFVFVLYPPELVFAGVDLAMEWGDELAADAPARPDRFHAYAPLPSWCFHEDLAPDVWPYEWAEAKAVAGL